MICAGFTAHLYFVDRQRREAKIREQYDRISAALLNTDSSKFAARNPTRVIPAVPGKPLPSPLDIFLIWHCHCRI
jgi:hypothetical protein